MKQPEPARSGMARAYVRLPTPNGDAFVALDAITAVVLLNEDETAIYYEGADFALLTGTSPEEIIGIMHEAFVKLHTVGLG